MVELTKEQLAILPKNIQEQVKAGLRNFDLTLTTDGKNALLDIIVLEKDKEFTELATKRNEVSEE